MDTAAQLKWNQKISDEIRSLKEDNHKNVSFKN
jgi:hypothetical protein